MVPKIPLSKNSKIVIGSLLLVLIVGHLLIALTSKVKIAGLFLARPQAGYSWYDEKNSDSRFFLRNLTVKWEAGVEHSEYKVVTSEKEGEWAPLPGYQFVNQAASLDTRWQPGLLHPDFQAWSDTGEGLWIPATGYKFVYEGDEFVATEWDPGQRYEALKIISLDEEDSFLPFQGYQFTNPGKTFDVAWTPGLVNTENPRLISGSKEGSWVVNSTPQRYYDDHVWLEREIARRVINRVF